MSARISTRVCVCLCARTRTCACKLLHTYSAPISTDIFVCMPCVNTATHMLPFGADICPLKSGVNANQAFVVSICAHFHASAHLSSHMSPCTYVSTRARRYGQSGRRKQTKTIRDDRIAEIVETPHQRTRTRACKRVFTQLTRSALFGWQCTHG